MLIEHKQYTIKWENAAIDSWHMTYVDSFVAAIRYAARLVRRLGGVATIWRADENVKAMTLDYTSQQYIFYGRLCLMAERLP